MTQKSHDEELREKLKHELETVEWTYLKPHMDRDAVIVISEELNLLEVAVKVANNDVTQVQEWIQSRQIGKPTPDQVKAWDSNPERHFLFLIIQPYVLIQLRPS